MELIAVSVYLNQKNSVHFIRCVNVFFLIPQNWTNEDTQIEVLLTAIQMIDKINEPEAIFRLLLSIGNIIHQNKIMSSLFKTMGGLPNVRSYINIIPKLKCCWEQIESSVESSISEPDGF